jgi:uncharacterized protein YdhG (YjbR/CyaY superfamily)
VRIVLHMSAVSDYLGSLDAPSRAAFEHILDLARELVPEAEEGTSYGMAALRLRQKPLLGFRAATGHLSVFPFSAEVVEAVQGRLAGFELSKGTIRFTAETPLPDDVVCDMVRLRAEEITGSAR